MSDLENIKAWAAIAAVLISCGVLGYNMWCRHVDQRTALRRTYDLRIDAQSQIITIHGTRLDKLETRMESVATRGDLAALDKSVVAIAGQVDVVVERLKPIAHTSERLQEFLYEVARARQPEPQA